MSKISQQEIGQLEVLVEHFHRAIESKPESEAIETAQNVVWNMAVMADGFCERKPENWNESVPKIKACFFQCADRAKQADHGEMAQVICRIAKSFKCD